MINAFHADYVQTYMPQFLTTIRTESAATANGTKFGSKSRATRESVDTNVNTISQFPKTKRVSLLPLEFLTYSRAGTKNTKGK
jgi:hypothetical protein